jgi:hypothetical protein
VCVRVCVCVCACVCACACVKEIDDYYKLQYVFIFTDVLELEDNNINEDLLFADVLECFPNEQVTIDTEERRTDERPTEERRTETRPTRKRTIQSTTSNKKTNNSKCIYITIYIYIYLYI